jgi:mRNA interferase MazF
MIDPQRGEVWLVDLGFVAKVRPCTVVSVPATDQDRALAMPTCALFMSASVIPVP